MSGENAEAMRVVIPLGRLTAAFLRQKGGFLIRADC